MTNLKAALARAGRPESTVPVVFAGHLVADLQQLERDYAAALVTNPADDSLESGGEARQIRERIDELRRELVESTVVFRLRALEPHAYNALRDQHPPREARKRDLSLGFNPDMFLPGLVKACTISPRPDAEDWALILGDPVEEPADIEAPVSAGGQIPPRRNSVLSHHYWTMLGAAAWNLNEAAVNIPFSLAASPTNQTSGGGSKQPNGSASVSDGSTAGNPAESPTTDTTGAAG